MAYDPKDDEDEEDTGTETQPAETDETDPGTEDDPGADSFPEPVSEEDRSAAVKEHMLKNPPAYTRHDPTSLSPLERASDLSAVKAAQQRAAEVTDRSEWGNAISNMIAPGNQQGNNEFFSGMRQNAAKGVGRAEDLRQQQIQNYMLQQKGKQDQHLQEAQDPTSALSQSVRKAYAQMFPDVVKGMGEAFNSLPAADIQTYMSKPMELKDAAMTRKAIADAKNQAHQDAVAEINSRRAAAADEKTANKEAAAEEKAGIRQAKARTELYDKTLGSRVPQDVAQARTASLAAKKAIELLDQYPDKDKMPEAQVALLNEEIGKIASGGVPTEGQLGHLNPHTLQQRWNAFLSQVGGKPRGAELKEFLKQNEEYLHGLKKVNDDIADNFVKQSYMGRHADMNETDKEEFRRSFPDAFQPVGVLAPGGKHPQKQSVPSGTAIAAPAASDLVTMKAPDGSIRHVKKEAVGKYRKQGAEVMP